jgi:dolichol-phosphate mannosyltransferase
MRSKTMKKVLVVIPTYNEADNIDQIIGSIERVAERQNTYTFNLLIVDDKSPDGTAKRVAALQKKYANIELLSGNKVGLGKAYIRGFQHALQHGDHDIFVMMDGDLSHNPEDIPALLDAVTQGSDYVIGSRYTVGGSISGNWPMIRKITSRTANFIARKLTGITDNITDLTGGFKAIRREALQSIDLGKLNVKGYIFQVSLLHAFIEHGFSISEVPITFTDRQRGKSKLKLRDVTEFLYKAYKLNPQAPIQKLVRFAFVGTCGAVVNLAILTALVRLFRFEVLPADIIAIEGSIIFNFFFNHLYTFRGYGSYTAQSRRESLNALLVKLGKFNVGTLGGAAINFLTFTFLYKEVEINYVISDLVAIIIAMSWNYFVSTRFVWKAIDEDMA